MFDSKSMFDLKSIKKTKQDNPERILIYGPHKIGKSTFASTATGSIFIQCEDGLDALNATAFPLCRRWSDILDCMTTLYQTDHGYQCIVLDTADWAEKLAQEEVCKQNNVKSIEAIGYGKGYVYVADLFKELLDGLNALRLNKKMRIIILAHSEIRRFDDPQADAYDRYQIKLHKLVGKLIQEWCDVIGFAQLDTITKVEKAKGFKDERTRAITTGQRVLRLTGSPSFDAGNRFSLPDSIPLIWSEYQTALDAARKGE
jgi:hypothetical protein